MAAMFLFSFSKSFLTVSAASEIVANVGNLCNSEPEPEVNRPS